jgi:O-antigen/teichoic acid export membrane protein
MKRKFVSDISANTLQVAINQGCGLLLFYILSLGLDKAAFGELNWSLAVLLTLFGILSFGIDQVAVRRIAGGAPAAQVLSAYLTHVLGGGLLLYALLGLAWLLFPAFFALHHLLLWVGIGKLAIFWATPFRQVANGLERFKALLYLSTVSSIVRTVALLGCYWAGCLNLQWTVGIFIVGDVAEWWVGYAVVRWGLGLPVAPLLQWQPYKALLREAAPQWLSVVFTTALSRLDWILIGFFCTAPIVANYSFAWKAFETATLPILITGPILLSRFSKLFGQGSPPPTAQTLQPFLVLLRVQLGLACGIALLMNLLWAPVIDGLTKGQYGAVNSGTVLWLSAALPLLYLNNFLWTIHFARHGMRTILWIIAVTFAVNLLGNLLLIPRYQGLGAAIAFVAATAVQTVLYMVKTPLPAKPWYGLPLLIAPLCAVLAGRAALYLFANPWVVVTVAILLYVLLLLALRQLRRSDLPSADRLEDSTKA